MSQVQVYTGGKWVGAGSLTVDASNKVDVLLLGSAFANDTNKWKYIFPTSAPATLAGTAGTALRFITSYIMGTIITTTDVPYPLLGPVCSFPDGTPIVGHALAIGPSNDAQCVYGIAIPNLYVTQDTKIDITVVSCPTGQISDWPNSALPLTSVYKFALQKYTQAQINISRAPSPSVSDVTFFGLSWGAFKSGMGAKAGAAPANFFSATSEHHIQFTKTSI